MKATERHRLKENELSHVISDATVRLNQNRRTVGLAIGLAVLVLAAAGGYWIWKGQTENRASALLGEAMVTMDAPIEEPKPGAKPESASYPTVRARSEAALAKLADVFNRYPSSEAGIAARYYAGAALSALGRPDEAAARYQEVVDRAGSDSFYGRMAHLGVVEASAQSKQYDKALNAAQTLVNKPGDDSIPRDALLMELGRVQAAAGKKAEAKQTFDKVIAEFPESAYIDEAKQLLATVS
jgi:TolA-binding protein